MKPLQPINHVDLNIHDVYTSRNLDHLRKFLYNNNTKKANFERSLAYNPSNLSNGISNLSYRLSKSPSNPSSQFTSLNVQFVSSSDVNRKDLLGRCLLHKLASSENEPEALEWLKVLAEHPQLQVNATDAENGWTALHRALFCGNLSFAKVLLDEIGCDIHIRDHEGMSAFALYNSTIDGACPAPAFTTKSVLEQNRTELFTWGNNRNFVLGIQGDRAHPERIHLKHPPHPNQPSSSSSQINAFLPIPVSVVAMCRLHTAVVTTTGELWICGFGSGGRLGLGWCNNKQPTGTQVHNNNITAQTQLTFARVKGALMNQRVKSVALGQDHTIIVTEAGHLYSCGLNRFGQLGYGADTMETPEYAAANSSSTNEVIQADPKRVLGPLKKEIVLGAAASKWHSACFTADALYTWGAHQGQLGYPSTSNNSQSTSIQTCPRKVTAASSPISQLTCTDYSTAFLCHNSDVFIIRSNSCIKVIFPSDRFPAHIPVYRPRDQGLGHLRIIKISAFDETLAAVSNMGDMFSLDLGRSTHSESNHAGQTQLTSANSQHHPQSFSSSANLYKPQRVWTLGKKFTAVTDAAVGMDGSIIFCTKSGHVFIHSKRTETQSSLKGGPARLGEQIKNTRNPKPTRIAHLERITKVSANPTGAFAAIREDATLNEIKIRCAAESISLPSALVRLLSHLNNYVGSVPELHTVPSQKALNHSFVRANEIGDEEDGSGPTENECEGEEDDHTFDWDEKVGCALIRMSLYWDSDQGLDLPLRNGDMILLVENKTILVHKFVLCSRSNYLRQVIEEKESHEDIVYYQAGTKTIDCNGKQRLMNLPVLEFRETSLVSLLLFVHYLYTDNYPELWDMRILRAFQRDYPEIIEETLKSNLDSLPIRLQKSKTDLERLASLTNLSALHKSLIRMGKVVPEARLSVDFEAQLSCSSDTKDRIKPDVELKLQSDEVISCHSTLLRAQCPFFQMLYEDDAWLVSRREVGTADGDLIRLDMSHFSKRAMELVMRHIYTDGATDLFFTEGFGSLDEFIDFVCDVMAIANELLMDKLKWICSVVLRDCINLNNVTSIAAEADFYKADALKDTCMNYIICNLETIFQDKALMNIPADLLLQIGQYLKRSQQVKFPQTRCQALKEALLHSNVTFLSELDLPKSKVGETPRFWKQFLKSLSNTSSNHQPTEITSTQSVSGLNESKSTGSLPMTTGLNLSSGSPGSYGGQSLCKSVPRVSPPPPTSSSTRVTSHSIPTPPSRLIDDREPDEGPFVMDELDHSESQPLKKSEGGKHAPWEGIATQNTRVDLRSIMLTEKPSEISNVSTYNSTKASPIRMSFETPMNMKLSQREKRRISLETSKQPTIENNVQIVKPSAWRTSPSNPKSMDVGKGVLKPISFVKGNVLNNKAVGRTEIQGESFEKHSSANGKMMGTTRLSPTMNRSNHEVPSSSFVGGGSSMKTKALDQVDPASAVGAAVITPMKMSVGNRSNSVSPGFRSQKYHQDTPWTNYSSTSSTSFYASGLPIGVGSGSSPPLRIEEEGMKVSRKEATNESGVMMTTDGMIESAQVHDSKLMKFSMIQNQQETESWAIKQKCKPSLIKIQEEENDRQIEMKREVEFLKWFEEESKKYQVIEQPQEGGVNGAGGQSKGKKKVKGRKSSGGIGGWDGQIQSKGSVGLEGQSSGFGSRMKSKEKNLKVSKLNVNMNDNHNQNQKDLLNLSINDLRCEDDFKKGKRIDKRIGCGPGSGSELHCTSSKSGHFHSSQQQPLPIGNRLQQQVKSK